MISLTIPPVINAFKGAVVLGKSGSFTTLHYFMVEHRNSPQQVDGQIETKEDRPLPEVANVLEFCLNEETTAHKCEKGDIFMHLKRLLLEQRNNDETEDWIQVTQFFHCDVDG